MLPSNLGAIEDIMKSQIIGVLDGAGCRFDAAGWNIALRNKHCSPDGHVKEWYRNEGNDEC